VDTFFSISEQDDFIALFKIMNSLSKALLINGSDEVICPSFRSILRSRTSDPLVGKNSLAPSAVTG
jgi:hypothetical protein